MRSQTLAAAMVLAVVVSASPAEASILFDLSPVDNSAVLTGYVTYDLQVTTDADWTAAAMLFELSAGSIYQHAQGVISGPPNPFLISLLPLIEFDTYVSGTAIGGAGDIGGTGLAFNDHRLDVSWYNMTDTDIGTTTIGRLTLTDDAAGSLSILLITADKDEALFDVAIVPGASPLVSQMIQETAGSGSDPGESWYDQLPKEWLLADGTTMWLIGDGPEGAVRKLNAYEQFNLLRHEGLWITPTMDGGRLRIPDGYFASTDTSWSYFTDPEPVDTTSDSGVPEPASLLLVGACLGAAMMRRR